MTANKEILKENDITDEVIGEDNTKNFSTTSTSLTEPVGVGDKELNEEDQLFEECEIAADYLEQLLDILDFDGDIDLDVVGDRAIVSIDGGKYLNKLVGRRGEILNALQNLTRLAVQQETGNYSRLMLDIDQWRTAHREKLTSLGTEVAQRVLDTGVREFMDPMSPFERKIVHDAVAAIDGVISESQGTDRRRRVVVIKA